MASYTGGSGGVCWKMVNTIYYHQEKKNKLRFREVKFLEAAESQFCTRMTAVAAVVLRVIRHKTKPYPYRILFSRRAHGTVPVADIRQP